MSNKIFKVCVYGSESTGKTTLCQKLAEYFNTVYVPEMARWILGDRLCVLDDFPMIAYAQFAETHRQMLYANRILICDTDLLVTKVYEKTYFNYVHQEVIDLQKLEFYDLYLVCDIDVPWISDAQRVLGDKREKMHITFIKELEENNISYVLINGNYEQRFIKAKETILNSLSEIP